jgi:hypothetical protein
VLPVVADAVGFVLIDRARAVLVHRARLINVHRVGSALMDGEGLVFVVLVFNACFR